MEVLFRWNAESASSSENSQGPYYSTAAAYAHAKIQGIILPQISRS